MDKRHFFSLLKEKLSRKPSDQFQKTFWTRFEGEFASRQIRFRPGPARARWLRWAFAPALALLALFFFKDNPFYRRNLPAADVAEVPYEKLIEQTELIENLDLFLGPADPMAAMDFSALTDEEWKILLAGDG